MDPDKQVVTRSVTVVVRGTQPVKVEENATQPLPAPRLPDGKPDLQGVWFGGDFAGGFTAGRGFGALSVLPAPDGLPNRPTPKPGLDNLRRQETRDGVGAGCFVESVPVYFGPAYHFQIVQNPQTIVMLVERMHLHRIIQIGAEHSADVLNGERLSYLGYSVAHWEGDTLVVDTRGFNDKVYVGTNNGSFTGGFKHSPKLHMVERFTRIDYGTLEVDVMLEDPDLFVSPWRSISRHPLRSEFSRIEEYICDQSPDAYKPLLEGITLEPAGQPSAPRRRPRNRSDVDGRNDLKVPHACRDTRSNPLSRANGRQRPAKNTMGRPGFTGRMEQSDTHTARAAGARWVTRRRSPKRKLRKSSGRPCKTS